MTYMLDARLERGVPSLTLIDAATGEERLHWRGDSAPSGGPAWQALFRRLMLLSCADRLSLVQRSKLPLLGQECLACADCIDHDLPPNGREWPLFIVENAGKVVALSARRRNS